jgi:hypothetical protein
MTVKQQIGAILSAISTIYFAFIAISEYLERRQLKLQAELKELEKQVGKMSLEEVCCGKDKGEV